MNYVKKSIWNAHLEPKCSFFEKKDSAPWDKVFKNTLQWKLCTLMNRSWRNYYNFLDEAEKDWARRTYKCWEYFDGIKLSLSIFVMLPSVIFCRRKLSKKTIKTDSDVFPQLWAEMLNRRNIWKSTNFPLLCRFSLYDLLRQAECHRGN